MKTNRHEHEVSAYLVGGGIGSLAAAVFMIRDGNLPGGDISIVDAHDVRRNSSNILIPTDASPVSNKAAKAGIALARRLGAKVTAYCAIEELQPIYGEGYVFNQKEIDAFEERAGEAGQKRVDAIEKMAKAASVPFTSVVTKTRTAYEGIIASATTRKCDVIFMASHGRRGLSRLIMGSVTQKVLSHSKITVVVYR